MPDGSFHGSVASYFGGESLVGATKARANMHAASLLRRPRPWALLAVVVLHLALFHALQAGLFHRYAEKPAVGEIIATLIPFEAPKPRATEPPKPLRASHAAPPRAAPQPVIPPANATPNEAAIALPNVNEALAPAAAPPPMPAPVAAAVEPLPVIPPRFDAAYLNNPAPPYPPLARRMGQQGKVLLRVHVSAEGRPQDVQLRATSGYARLDEVALETVKQWRFVPAQQGGEAVDAWVLVPMVFRLES